MQTFADIWAKSVEKMVEFIPAVSLNLWIKCITPVKLDRNTIILYVENSFQRDLIMTRYLDIIKLTVSEVFGFDIEVKIYTEDDKPEDLVVVPKQEESVLPTELIFPSSNSSDEDYSFDNFIVGNSNRFAHAASIAVAQKPALTSYNPLFIYGPSGLGKTHLLFAIQNEVKKNYPDYNIVYISSEKFTNEIINAIKTGTTEEFRNNYRSADVLLVDDVQFIGGKASVQEEFFNTFNTLTLAKKQIVLVSDRPPREIQLLDDRLRSRFEGGLLADVQTPDYELRMAIIRTRAESLNVTISDDVMQFIANRLKNNIRQLEGAIKKILAYYLLTGTQPSLAIAQSAIKDVLNENEPLPITIDRIITEVSRYYNIPVDDIKGKKRTADITNARQISMYIIREVTQMSLPEIGKEFNGRDHSTVHHSINKIEDDMRNNSGFKSVISDLIKNVREK
ncbi:MAG: chromosomal replication initiator protein DnaA [Clostridia bacterium]